jgi:hypothetical protein
MLFCAHFRHAKLRPIEALHVLVLVLFVAWMPFCFKDMNSFDVVLRESNISMTAEGIPSAVASARISSAFLMSSSEDAAQSISSSQKLDSSIGCPPERNRLLLFCFLTFAVISGGVLNLDAFDALPVL